MSEKGQARKSMFSVQNMEELRRLYDSDTPVLAYDFKRRMVEGWTPEHSHHRGQLVALTQGLHPGASGSPDDAKHESARESVRQRQLRELYEDTETGGDIRQRLPRFGTPDRERREIHRTLLQSMPFAFSAGLPPTGRVRRRIRTATRRGEFGGLDTNLCPRPIVSEFTSVCQCANKTVSLGVHPRASQ